MNDTCFCCHQSVLDVHVHFRNFLIHPTHLFKVKTLKVPGLLSRADASFIWKSHRLRISTWFFFSVFGLGLTQPSRKSSWSKPIQAWICSIGISGVTFVTSVPSADFETIAPTQPTNVVDWTPTSLQPSMALQLQQWLQHNVVTETTMCSKPVHVSPLFGVPKKDPQVARPILDTRQLNRHSIKRHFQMDTFKTARTLLEKGDWMCKIDLT